MTAARPLAVVTGASSGIGLELAKLFAAAGHDLIIAAEDAAVRDAKAGLEAAGVSVSAVQVNLARQGAVEELYARIRAAGRPLEAVVLSVAAGHGGAFADTRLEDELAIVDLNVRSTVHLAKHVVRDTVAQGHGRILFTSAMPGPAQAVYHASTAFLQAFAVALRDELAGTGVTVTTLMPGPGRDDPAELARLGFEAAVSVDA